MNYKYPELEGICKEAIKNNRCTGCNRLEMPDFKGLQSCKYVKTAIEEINEILGIQEKIKL